jgi:hypothetical protein
MSKRPITCRRTNKPEPVLYHGKPCAICGNTERYRRNRTTTCAGNHRYQNPEYRAEILNRNAEYYEDHKEEAKAAARERHALFRDVINEWQREDRHYVGWRLAQPERYKECCRKAAKRQWRKLKADPERYARHLELQRERYHKRKNT